MALKIFLDTNILVDHLQNRNQFSIDVIKLCERGIIEGYISSASLYTIVFLVKKYTSMNPKVALESYLEILEPLPMYRENFYASFASQFHDLEDAFQYFTALQKNEMNHFITNNVKDFKLPHPKLPVLSAEKFIKSFC